MVRDPSLPESSKKFIPLFDSNAHPDAVKDPSDDSYADYVNCARDAGFVGACAVGLPGTDPVQHLHHCREAGFLTPVAPWQASGTRRLGRAVRTLSALGYRALKVHPRWGGPTVGSREFRQLLRCADDLDMVVFLCTYPFGSAKLGLGDRLLHDLDSAIAAAPNTRLVLLHGGAIDLLRWIEFCRANEHLLLDLSHTLVKYAGSSLDDDLAFAFANFDRRICVGTDHPYYSIDDVVCRLELFLGDIPEHKRQNILRRNIEDYLAPR